MIHKNTLPSQAHIASRITYDPLTGEFTWLAKPNTDARTKAWNRRYAGGRAGSVTNTDAVQIRFADENGEIGTWTGHRLAFVLMTGRAPTDEIDHINRVPNDNRWVNLRECTRAENNANRGVPCNSTTGVKGVSRRADGRFEAYVKQRHVKHHCGFWQSATDAARCVRIVRKLLHGEFARH